MRTARLLFFTTLTLIAAGCNCSGKIQDKPKQFHLAVIGKGQGTVSSEPKAILCGGSCDANFDENTEVTLVASPGDFVRWEGACQDASGANCNLKMDADKAVYVTFLTPITVHLVGSGSVTSAPTGVSCSQSCAASAPDCLRDCSGGVDPEQPTTLMPQAASGFMFSGWSGTLCAQSGTGACVVPAGTTGDVTATFVPGSSNSDGGSPGTDGGTDGGTSGSDGGTNTLVVNVVGTGTGSVTSSNPSGISCPNACNLQVAAGSQVTLTAAANTGSSFVGWSGGCTGISNSCTVTLDTSKSVTARFNANAACGWAKNFGSTGDDVASGVAIDRVGGRLAVTGSAGGSISFGGPTLNFPTSGAVYVAVLDQNGNHLSSFGKGHSGSVTRGDAIAWTPDGGVAIAGAFSGPVDFGSGIQDAGTVGFGTFRGYTAEYTPGGNLVFFRPLGETYPQNDAYCGVTTDPVTGEVTVVGSYAEPENFGGPTTYTPNASNMDYYVARYDAAGSFKWVKAGSSSAYSQALAVATGNSGELLWCGSFAGAVDFGGGATAGTTVDSAVFASYGAGTGNFNFGKTLTPPADGGIDDANAIAVAPNGDFVVAGGFSGQTDFGGTTLTSTGYMDAYVARYSPDGTLQWVRGLGGSTWDEGLAVAADNNNVYLAGTFTGTPNFEGTPATNHGGVDMFLARFTSTGSQVYVRTFGSAGTDIPHGLVLDAAGNIYLVGSFEDTMSLAGTTLTPVGGGGTFSDAFVACLNP